jgi:hypothetical protein
MASSSHPTCLGFIHYQTITYLTFSSFTGLDQNLAGGTILLYFLQFASHSMCGTKTHITTPQSLRYVNSIAENPSLYIIPPFFYPKRAQKAKKEIAKKNASK